jgi:deoxyribodipyrimidine photo-lyase
VRAANETADADRQAYLEELIVRRELAANFVEFQSRYDDYTCLPGWARATLDVHRADERPQIYTREQLESARTHDRYWNAAMREMRDTGFMHNYMRMYWAKKILEWTADPEAAFRTVLHLNNKYFLDGRDANSYANVAWIFGMHDRPWPERPVFGKVRYMNAKGLERKFDMAAYLRTVDALIDAERG